MTKKHRKNSDYHKEKVEQSPPVQRKMWVTKLTGRVRVAAVVLVAMAVMLIRAVFFVPEV